MKAISNNGGILMIQVEKLCFSYSKRNRFINDMDFKVEKGEIFGFLGPSGAGKSTVQKILTGILKDYGGSVRVLGSEVKSSKRDFYQQIGVDFEFPNLYGKFTALENLNFFSSLYDRRGYAPMDLLERVGLKNDAFKRVSEFSKGMKMRLSFIRAIQHKPALIFLDEPTSGLDAVTEEMIFKAFRAIGTKRTILTISHRLSGIIDADEVYIMASGKIVQSGSPEKLAGEKGWYNVFKQLEDLGWKVEGPAL
jgi:fluoroquinolone transport system ATP-binding protein